jgi:hypothetical protein
MQFFQQPGGAVEYLFFIPVQQARHDANISGNGIMREQAIILEYVSYALAQGRRRLFVDPFIPDPYFAGTGLYKTIDHFKEGRLTTAAHPQEYNRLPFFYGKGNIIDSRESSEGLRYIFHLNHPIHGPGS